ncbi:hypothetical protein ACWGI8_29515 [Streptomyces sp. NPDC054841]
MSTATPEPPRPHASMDLSEDELLLLMLCADLRELVDWIRDEPLAEPR